MGKILGISAFYHDSAAAIVEDGKIIAAAQEERFTRKKHDPGFPDYAIRHVLELAGWRLEELDGVVFYDKPLLKFERLLETFVANVPSGVGQYIRAMPVWAGEKLFQKKVIRDHLIRLSGCGRGDLPRLMFTEHHYAHAASAFYPSPLEESAVLCLDGVGEWASTTTWVGHGSTLKPFWKIDFPHSLGLLYSAFTYYCGFRVNSGEYKLMGLAPYGVPRYADRIRDQLVDIKRDGTYRLNMEYFTFPVGKAMTGERFESLFGAPVRDASSNIEKFHADIAASIQLVLEEIVLRMAGCLLKETGMENLCLAGGVALNCVANSRIAALGNLKKLWIQPASGDAGGALGAALAIDTGLHQSGRPHLAHHRDGMSGALLGPGQSEAEIRDELVACGAVFEEMHWNQLVLETADALAHQKIVGWVQGRMEFGPRALGNRSILADPRSEKMQSWINRKIKFREGFRPFAPVVTLSHVEDFFDMPADESPYMLLTGRVKGFVGSSWSAGRAMGKLSPPEVDSPLPAVTHVNGSARVQTVDARSNPLLVKLIHAFEGRTGVPVLVNTSFNVRGEPIVFRASDAFRCFMNTHMDILVVGKYFMRKGDQTMRPDLESWKNQFPLD